jgi:(R,R)-butanediol dehydrogenase/meso-butanediol dehydrogenase/diacetyl reductase
MHGPQDVRVEDVPEPDPAAGEVKIKVAANGLCGSDLHIYFMSEPREQGAAPPFILGHEFSGEVAEVGRDVTDLTPGERVTVEPLISCGACPACQAGADNVCAAVAFYGVGPGHDGGLAEFAVVQRKHVHRLPPGISLRDGALVEPMAVAYHAVRRGAMSPGQTAAIFGAGPIGIGVYLNLVADGVERIIVVEPSPVRGQAIRTLGAGEVLDPLQTDVVGTILEKTGGKGVDVAFEAAGAPAGFTAALGATARQGRVVIVALHEQPVAFSPLHLIFTEQTLTGALAYAHDYAPVLQRMAAGAYPTRGWVDTIALDEVIKKGFVALRGQQAVKVLVDVSR